MKILIPLAASMKWIKKKMNEIKNELRKMEKIMGRKKEESLLDD